MVSPGIFVAQFLTKMSSTAAAEGPIKPPPCKKSKTFPLISSDLPDLMTRILTGVDAFSSLGINLTPSGET